MKKGDGLLLGLDIKKNPNVIQRAYFDGQGITKRFNLNLLTRINREFDGDFDVNNFDFYSNYNPRNGEVNSYIVNLKNQKVHLKKLNVTLDFKLDELIWTELSKKYDLEEIETLAQKSGFLVKIHFLDSKNYFHRYPLNKISYKYVRKIKL